MPEEEKIIIYGNVKTKLAVGDIIVEFESLCLPPTVNAQIALNLFDGLQSRAEGVIEEDEPDKEPEENNGVKKIDIDGQKEFEDLLNVVNPIEKKKKLCANTDCDAHKDNVEWEPEVKKCPLCGGTKFI